MGGKANVSGDVQFCGMSLSQVERSMKSRLLPSFSTASPALSAQDKNSTSEIIGDAWAGSGPSNTANSSTSTLYDEAGVIRDGLKGLTFESGEDTDSAPEGIAAGDNDQRSGLVTGEKGVLSNALLPRQLGSDVDLDYVLVHQPQGLVHAPAYGERARAPRGLTHEYRLPPALRLPDQTVMDHELATLPQGRECACVPTNFRLPATLVGSPSCQASCHDGKAVLDPNAKEYTPVPSPCISPVVPHSLNHQHIGVPSSYSLETGHIFVPGLDNCSMMIGSSYRPDSAVSTYGTISTMSLYRNGSEVAYGPGSATLASWGKVEVSDLTGREVAVSVEDHVPVTRIGLAQPLPSSHPLRPLGTPPFQIVGLPSVGITGHSILAHPPTSGREHVSRSILLNGVPLSMTDEHLKTEMGKWGDVRAVVSDQKNQGLVTVNFYDLRCAKEALRDIQQQHLIKQQRMQQHFQFSQKQRGTPTSSNSRETMYAADERQDAENISDMHTDCSGLSSISPASAKGLIDGVVMWAQYTLPLGTAAGPDGMNQGTLVVFNLDINTTMEHLKSVFEAYGDIKELRETPAKKQHKFVEFYDVRDASKALKALDGTEVDGKRVKIEFSRPGGQAHKARVLLQQQSQGTTSYHTSSTVRPALVGSGPTAVSGHPFYMNWSGDVRSSPLPMPGLHGSSSYLWASSIGTPAPPVGLSLPLSWSNGRRHIPNCIYASMQAVPASAAGPLVVMDALSFGRVGSRAMAIPCNGGPVCPGEVLSTVPGFGRGSGIVGSQGRADGVSSRRKRNSTVNGDSGFGKVDSAVHLGFGNRLREGPRVGTRISANKLATRADIPPQYVFDEAGVQANETHRTTLMIKNIPNKYSQQMLLALLDNHCTERNKQSEGLNEPESAYDFVYLPIDFKNRCNLGYAFVNFTSIQATMRLYRDFHLQQWEEFNSRKVCHVTYARVQGRLALEEHFKNSRFACDTDDYLPLIFRPPRNGKNSSLPATVAAVHQSSRVLDTSLEEYEKGSHNGEKREDERPNRVFTKGVVCASQELEIDLSTGQSRCALGGHG